LTRAITSRRIKTKRARTAPSRNKRQGIAGQRPSALRRPLLFLLKAESCILVPVPPDFVPIFQEVYRALRPRAPMPPILVRFRRFTSLSTTIRLREGEIRVSLSDLLEGAPESVIHAI